MAGTHEHLKAARPIPVNPWIVSVPSGSTGGSIHAFLVSIQSSCNFDTIADAVGLWATPCTDTLEQDTSGGSAWVVSAEAYKYLKAFRY